MVSYSSLFIFTFGEFYDEKEIFAVEEKDEKRFNV